MASSNETETEEGQSRYVVSFQKESSVPKSSTIDENYGLVHTISGSRSFDSSVSFRSRGSANRLSANATFPLNTEDNNNIHSRQISPELPQLNQSFSADDLLLKSLAEAESEASSVEVVLSDSSDTPVVQEFDATAMPQQNTNDGTVASIDYNSQSDDSSTDDSREGDSEVFLAKQMALAITKHPDMTPSQLREMQHHIQRNVERKQRENKLQANDRKNMVGRRMSTKKKIKEAYKETKQNAKGVYKEKKQSAKGAYKDAKAGAKAGAKNIKEEVKIGLRAMGLKKPSETSTGTALPPITTIGEDSYTLLNTSAKEPLAALSPASTTDAGIYDCEKGFLAGIIWKRRSGLGKYSLTAPWERRRVLLKGTKLIYYKTLQETENNAGSDEEDMSNSERDAYASIHGSLNQSSSVFSGLSDDITKGINSIIDKTGVSIPWENNISSPTARGSRGYLDLRKEKASASASYGHTGAPTPFALSIKVASLTKYKLCFDTQQELMQWLAAITDVVVAGSVDTYNAEILNANDPSSHGDPVSAVINNTGLSWQEPSARNSVIKSKEEGGGLQLWSTEHYKVSSADNHAGFTKSNSNIRDVDCDDDNDDDENAVVGGKSDDYLFDTSTGESFLAIPAGYMEPAFYLINAVILVSRAETTLSNELFWYVLVFFNVLALFTINKVQVGGAIRLKPELGKTQKKKVIKKKQEGTRSRLNSGDTYASEPSERNLKIETFVPPAGSTSMRIENPSDLPTKNGVIFAGWREVEPSSMLVRGCGYKTNKTKVPCPNSLYRCVDLDVFESLARVPDIAGRVQLPPVKFDDDGPKTWNAPDYFVVTVALPTDPPKLYGGSTDNGGGYTITMYCVMRQETRNILKRVTADGYNPSDEERKCDPNKSMVNAVRLFDEWCRRAPSDDNWMSRFKVVPQGDNLVEIGIPAWISNYNGKPFLIKRPGTTGFLYRHPDKSCMEFDVSLHPFPYLAKQGICYLKEGFFKKILATLAFCIEGRADDELPECLIGLFQLCYPDPLHAVQGEDFFAGKSARSK